jgi:glycosyltransferase involved in cell wall biosynthesis
MTTNKHFKSGLYVLCSVIFESGGRYYFYDRRNVERALIIRGKLDSLAYVARIRHVDLVANTCIPLDPTKFNIAAVLPDYGVGGWKGIVNFIKLLCLCMTRSEFAEAIRSSSFIYAEAPSFEAWGVSRLARKMGKKFILEVNTESTLDIKYMWQRFGAAGLIMVPIIAIFFKYVRKISSGGLYLNKRLLDKYPVTGSKTVVVCKPSLSNEWYSSGRRRFSVPASRFLFVGNLEKVKQVDFILRALYSIKKLLSPGWKFEIVGDGPERSNLERLVDRLELCEQVIFRGRVKRDENLRACFMDNDILLIASLSETGPRVLLEALAVGMPVLSTKVGLAQELLTEECLTEVGDLKGYADKLLSLSLNLELLLMISEANRDKAELFKEDVLLKIENDFFEVVINK